LSPLSRSHSATTALCPLSLHDALPIYAAARPAQRRTHGDLAAPASPAREQQVREVRARDQQHQTDGREQREQREPHRPDDAVLRSEEHTSELQSRENLVCRLLLEKKNK